MQRFAFVFLIIAELLRFNNAYIEARKAHYVNFNCPTQMTPQLSSQALHDDLDQIVRKAKLRLLQMHYASGVGHIGGNRESWSWSGLAAGLVALGKTFKSQPGRVFSLTSDGEWNEGSYWEFLIFIAHRQLKNL